MKIITFVIPVYNTEKKYLARCLKTFEIEFDPRIEIIIVDDGSNTETKKFLLEESKKIKCDFKIIHKSNGGQNSARNEGIKHASGLFIGFLDSDDCIDWNILKKIIPSVNITDEVFVYGAIQIDENGNKIGERNYKCEKQELIRLCQELWSFLIRKDVFDRIGGLYERAHIGEDFISLILILDQVSRIKVLEEKPYIYTYRKSSITHNTKPDQVLELMEAFSYLEIKMLSYDIYISEIEWQAIYHLLYVEAGNLIKKDINNQIYIDIILKWMKKHFPNWKDNKYLKKTDLKKHLSFRLCISGNYKLYSFLFKIKKGFAK